jgi:Zn-finger nucleic acid-binding protein
MLYREAEPGDCPACAGRLADVDIQRARARHCANCGGLWLDRADADDTLKYGGYNVDMLDVLRELAARDVAPVDIQAPYPCRVCRHTMRRENIEGITIDRCDEHGLWFDHNELLQVLNRSTPPGIAFNKQTKEQREKAQISFFFGWTRR